jgi:hypothetical protein
MIAADKASFFAGYQKSNFNKNAGHHQVLNRRNVLLCIAGNVQVNVQGGRKK